MGIERCDYCQAVVKSQLAGRVLDEKTHDANFTHEQIKDLWRVQSPTQVARPEASVLSKVTK